MVRHGRGLRRHRHRLPMGRPPGVVKVPWAQPRRGEAPAGPDEEAYTKEVRRRQDLLLGWTSGLVPA